MQVDQRYLLPIDLQTQAERAAMRVERHEPKGDPHGGCQQPGKKPVW